METSEKLKKNYENYYEDGDSEWRRLGALGKVDNIVSLCSSLSRHSILEVGAGEGSVLMRLSELCFAEELFALEISPSGVETIKNKKIPLLVECKLFDGYHIPYSNDRFDIAILSHVIEHVENPRQLLYEVSRVAKYIFIEVPLEDTLRLSNDFIFDKVGHINFYSPKTIRRLVQSSNLVVLNQILTNPPKATYIYQKGSRGLINYYTKQILMLLVPQLAANIFTYHAALICEKQ